MAIFTLWLTALAGCHRTYTNLSAEDSGLFELGTFSENHLASIVHFQNLDTLCNFLLAFAGSNLCQVTSIRSNIEGTGPRHQSKDRTNALLLMKSI